MKRILIFPFLAVAIIGALTDAPCDETEAPPKGTPESVEILVGMAASLQDLAPGLKNEFARFAAARGHAIEPTFVFAGSGKLFQQTISGAPYDLLFLAGSSALDKYPSWKSTPENFAPILSNRLVLAATPTTAANLIAATGSFIDPREKALAFFDGVERVGVGDPAMAPVGRYAHQVIRANPTFEAALRPKIIAAESVAHLAVWLQNGEVDLAFVYASDALRFQFVPLEGIETVLDDHDPIVYPAVVVPGASQPEEARLLLQFLQSEVARKIFQDGGFSPPGNFGEPNTGAKQPTTKHSLNPDVDFLGPLLLSLAVGFAALCLNLVVGAPLAWALARHEFPGKWIIEMLLTLPIVLPPTVLGYLVILGFGRQSPIGSALLDWTGWSLLFTWWGAVAASTLVSFPLLVRPLQAAFQAIPAIYFEEGTLLGLSPQQEFRWLGLPMAWRGLAVGVALSLARALGEFGATLMIAGNIPGRTQTLPVAVYSAATLGEWKRAGVYAGMLLILALGLVLVSRLAARRDVDIL